MNYSGQFICLIGLTVSLAVQAQDLKHKYHLVFI